MRTRTTFELEPDDLKKLVADAIHEAKIFTPEGERLKMTVFERLEWVTVKQAAAMLKISAASVRNYLGDGRLTRREGVNGACVKVASVMNLARLREAGL